MRQGVLQLTCDCCGKTTATNIPIVARIYSEVVSGGRIARSAIQQGMSSEVQNWISPSLHGSFLLDFWNIKWINDICAECYQEQEWLRQELLINLPDLKKRALKEIEKDPYAREEETATYFWKDLRDLENKGIPQLAAAFHREMIKD